MFNDKGRKSSADDGSAVLSNLAKGDPQQRMLLDFEKLFDLTYDEKFVTARHSLQALWKVDL